MSQPNSHILLPDPAEEQIVQATVAQLLNKPGFIRNHSVRDYAERAIRKAVREIDAHREAVKKRSKLPHGDFDQYHPDNPRKVSSRRSGNIEDAQGDEFEEQ